MAKAKTDGPGSGVARPSWFWFVLLDGGIVMLARLVFSQSAYDKAGEVSKGALPPRQFLRALLVGTAVIHVGEAFAAGVTARRRGLASPGRWALQTLIVGFPSLLALRKTGRS